MNIIDQWYSIFCHGIFEGMELYTIKIWVKVITEGLDTTYLLINNTLIKNINKTKVPL